VEDELQQHGEEPQLEHAGCGWGVWHERGVAEQLQCERARVVAGSKPACRLMGHRNRCGMLILCCRSDQDRVLRLTLSPRPPPPCCASTRWTCPLPCAVRMVDARAAVTLDEWLATATGDEEMDSSTTQRCRCSIGYGTQALHLAIWGCITYESLSHWCHYMQRCR
jgi:hypothetical protein